ncbi:helix-turn-helix domain-containing protein [Nocardia asteroides]|uniref:helix-turn-helix domain-containing protein n=1 Tax=Nocardia asteroides TaxID=1824 RepID=UPI0037C70367
MLAAYRHHPSHGHRPLPQTELARWLGISQARLCRLENQRAHIDQPVLADIAHILGIPEELLWFDPRAGTAAALGPASGTGVVRLPSGMTVPAMSAPTDAPLAATLLATLSHYASLDMLAGPHDLLDLVEKQLSAIDSAMNTDARGRKKLLYVSARFAEFLGWLHQDAGNLHVAMKWSDVALNRADECGDPQLRAYVLMRKSNIAGDTGDTAASVNHVEEALANATALTPRQRSVLLRQKGHAYATLTTTTSGRGDHRACVDALTEAAELAAEVCADVNDLAQYCSPGYVAMEAAHCWVQLGRPEKALTTLEAGLSDWAPGSNRDLGMGFARLATAYAGLSQPDEALDVARHALTIHAATGSYRTIQQLQRVGIALEERGHRGHTQDFAAMLRTHLATARVAPAVP